MPLGGSLLLSDSHMSPEGSDGLLQKGCVYLNETGRNMTRIRFRRVYESFVKANKELGIRLNSMPAALVISSMVARIPKAKGVGS